jgi:endogenous inhibitor of DNA gyrase (YacG/DUF329 family)
MSKTLVVKCPICKVLVDRKTDTFPFCSERCQTTDLGNWASDKYSIPGASSAHDFDDGDGFDNGEKVIH